MREERNSPLAGCLILFFFMLLIWNFIITGFLIAD